MDIDIYFERLGEFGRYNVIFLTLVCVFGSAVPSWQILSFVFIFYEPPHHCKPDGELNASIPLADNGGFESCVMYADDYRYNRSIDTVPCKEGWSYDVEENEATLVTELDLVCQDSIYAANAVSVYFAGILFSSLVGGYLSDTFGRKRISFVSMGCGIVAGVSLTFTRNYASFVILWFFSAVFNALVLTCFFTLIIEMFSSKRRTAAICLIGIAWSIGLCFLTPIAYKFQNWRHFGLAIHLPTILALPSWWFFVESPRWLINKNKFLDARAAFKKIANINNISEDKQQWINTLQNVKSENEEVEKSKKIHTILDMIKTPRLRKITILMAYIWFVDSMVYYGLSHNSSKIAGNRFINFLVITVAEFPASLLAIYILPRYGRRPQLLLFQCLAALACIIVAFVPKETAGGVSLYFLITTLSFIGKFCISLTFTIIWLFASEIYPTIIRTTGVFTCSMFARFGGIAAPYIMHLVSTVPVLHLY
ncbi:organic cation transporter 1-like [Anneissia japonica]|uniref:organic cation transporter 1-like n=1 Tax=Anneissia japonica TaxID=1529436 RepID=UPI0014259552|nr:organic cation transporter 1-like [Anneissia japonica]